MPREARCLFIAATLAAAMALPMLPGTATAQNANTSTITINAQSLIPRATLFISPASESIIEGSTFEVSVYLDTKQNSANTVDVTLQFPPDKMAIVNPSAGKSLIQAWLQPPSYSNVQGNARYTGIIPNGVVTGSGLIVTIVFKAIGPGNASVIVSPASSVLANDGLGTVMNTEFGRASYAVTPKPPGDVVVFSETHPFPSQWYNNKNPVLGWQKDPNVTDFSYTLDNLPNTVPNDVADATGTATAYENLGDGLWYFHIKARKLGVWGSPTHFLARIDTHPPAEFTPVADVIDTAGRNQILLSFFSTDDLSGIDHYEVATIDKQGPAVASPVFVQAESPYKLAVPGPGNYKMIVRAFDRAGNVRDATIDVGISVPFVQFLKKYDLLIIIGFLALVVFLFLLQYFFGHKLLRRVHKAILAVERAEKDEEVEEAKEFIESSKAPPPPAAPQQP